MRLTAREKEELSQLRPDLRTKIATAIKGQRKEAYGNMTAKDYYRNLKAVRRGIDSTFRNFDKEFARLDALYKKLEHAWAEISEDEYSSDMQVIGPYGAAMKKLPAVRTRVMNMKKIFDNVFE